MLVLGRHPGQSVRVGNGVMTILAIKGNLVKVGFEFPVEVEVMRTEIDQRRAAQAQHSFHDTAPLRRPRLVKVA